MKPPFVSIIGIGNILRKDDGVGIRAIKHIQERYVIPPNLSVIDGGTTGMALLPYVESAEYLIIIDAINGEGDPGTLYDLSLDQFRLTIPKKISMHDLGFLEVMTVAEINERLPKETSIIGIKPENIYEDSTLLSDSISKKLEDLVKLVISKLATYGITLNRHNKILKIKFPFD